MGVHTGDHRSDHAAGGRGDSTTDLQKRHRRLLLDAKFTLRRAALSDRQGFGLDPDLTVVEKAPLVIQQRSDLSFKPVDQGM